MYQEIPIPCVFNGASDAVRVWTFDIGPGAQANLQSIPGATACLSPKEHARAERFSLPEHAHRFVAFHAIKRLILADVFQCKPCDVPFSWAESGAPVLGGARESRFGRWPSISLSHSRDVGVLALATKGIVGIDVEYQRVVGNPRAIVARKFGDAAAAGWTALAGDPTAQQELFFRLWTAREARYKCTGSYAQKPGESVHHWQQSGFSYAMMHVRENSLCER